MKPSSAIIGCVAARVRQTGQVNSGSIKMESIVFLVSCSSCCSLFLSYQVVNALVKFSVLWYSLLVRYLPHGKINDTINNELKRYRFTLGLQDIEGPA